MAVSTSFLSSDRGGGAVSLSSTSVVDEVSSAGGGRVASFSMSPSKAFGRVMLFGRAYGRMQLNTKI